MFPLSRKSIYIISRNSGKKAVARYCGYDAFGNEINPDSSDTNPYRYCGEYYDFESGTVYLRARYYSPTHGRFTQVDSARDGLNWYAYCANNPIAFVDPWGLSLTLSGSEDYEQIIFQISEIWKQQ